MELFKDSADTNDLKMKKKKYKLIFNGTTLEDSCALTERQFLYEPSGLKEFGFCFTVVKKNLSP